MRTRKVRKARRTMAFLAGLITFVFAPPASASADRGVTRERIRFEVVGLADEDLSTACGVPVIVDSSFNIHIVEFADGRSKIHINSQSTLSSAFGDVRTIGASMIQFEAEQLVDNGDGTLTVLVPHRESVGFVYLTAEEKVADAGIIDWEIRLVIDAATGDLLNEEEVVVQTIGHFPVFSRDGGALSLLCDALRE